MMQSRSLAKKAGDNKYRTGKPCKNGHLTYRYTSSGTCADCLHPRFASFATNYIDKIAIKHRYVLKPAHAFYFAKLAADLIVAKHPAFNAEFIANAATLESDKEVNGYQVFNIYHLEESIKELSQVQLDLMGC